MPHALNASQAIDESHGGNIYSIQVGGGIVGHVFSLSFFNLMLNTFRQCSTNTTDCLDTSTIWAFSKY